MSSQVTSSPSSGQEFFFEWEETVLKKEISNTHGKKKVKSSMVKSLPVENLLPQNVGSIINYLQ